MLLIIKLVADDTLLQLQLVGEVWRVRCQAAEALCATCGHDMFEGHAQLARER
jgi:hypothetical protein